jgi:hypothetical protein
MHTVLTKSLLRDEKVTKFFIILTTMLMCHMDFIANTYFTIQNFKI